MLVMQISPTKNMIDYEIHVSTPKVVRRHAFDIISSLELYNG